jgi:hypothetical protein
MEPYYEPHPSPVSRSIAIHAILAALIYYFFFYNQPADSGKSPETVQIDTINESAPAPKKSQRTASKNHYTPSTQATSRSHSISLSDLGMRLNTAPMPQQKEGEENSPPPTENDGEDSSWDMLNPDPRIARFNQYVYNTVQGWLDRDAYLNRQALYGTVKVKIWFSADGEYLENETEYEAIDEDFKKIVARALHKSFMNPIPHPYMYKHEKFSIVRTVVIRNM